MFVQNKKLVKVFFTLGCTCLLTTSSVFAADYVSITTDKANVRTGPGTNYAVAMELFQGYPLKIEEKNGDWYKVTDYENDSGWVNDSIVKKADTVIVNAKESINMRSGPSATAPVVADVERGVVMTKLGEEGEWTKVRHSSGTTGYVFTPLLWP